MLYDDKWRVIARFEDAASASAPFEQIYHHHAGLAGHGGSSYIDLVICRDQIDNSGDPPTATRDYVLQNWRADVVALAAPDGDLLERITYDAYASHNNCIRACNQMHPLKSSGQRPDRPPFTYSRCVVAPG